MRKCGSGPEAWSCAAAGASACGRPGESLAARRRRLCLRRLHLPDLPDVRVLRTENPQTTAFIELRARQATRAGRAAAPVQRWVDYARISPNLMRAVLVAEDSTFWEHEGVDFKQMKESMEVNLERMEFERGASTITQQLAKNLYLSPSKNPDSEGPRTAHRAAARSRAVQAAHPGALPERHRVGQWHLRRRGGGADLFRQVRGGARAAGVGAARRRDHQPAAVESRQSEARLRRRQEMILRRMGAATPPPVIAEPTPARLPDRARFQPFAPCRAAPLCCREKSCRRRAPPGLRASRAVRPRAAAIASAWLAAALDRNSLCFAHLDSLKRLYTH